MLNTFVTMFLSKKKYLFTKTILNCLKFLDEMNNTIFNKSKRIELLENMLYDQARQVAEKFSGLYKLFSTT